MYIARGLLILSFGSMLRFISCYSDGGLLEDQDQCQDMNINHNNANAQDTESPFKVEPESVTLTDSEWNNATITVTLSGGSREFIGFMLDSRQCDNCKPVGTFTSEDPDNSLLICGNKVVVHPNNIGKRSIRVSWKHEAAGLLFFRAAVVEYFFMFWRRKRIDLPSTTPPPTETSAHIRLTTSPTIFPTDSHATAFLTGTSSAPTISEANSAQTNLTTSTTKFTTSNIDSQATAFLTGTSPAPTISEANSAQTNLTTGHP